MTSAICLIFFLSGAAALLFETLWFRLAGLVFGNSVWAASLVLASFMGGLALGNTLAARYGPRLRRRSEEHTSELQSQSNLVCRLLLEKKKKNKKHSKEQQS